MRMPKPSKQIVHSFAVRILRTYRSTFVVGVNFKRKRCSSVLLVMATQISAYSRDTGTGLVPIRRVLSFMGAWLQRYLYFRCCLLQLIICHHLMFSSLSACLCPAVFIFFCLFQMLSSLDITSIITSALFHRYSFLYFLVTDKHCTTIEVCWVMQGSRTLFCPSALDLTL